MSNIFKLISQHLMEHAQQRSLFTIRVKLPTRYVHFTLYPLERARILGKNDYRALHIKSTWLPGTDSLVCCLSTLASLHKLVTKTTFYKDNSPLVFMHCPKPLERSMDAIQASLLVWAPMATSPDEIVFGTTKMLHWTLMDNPYHIFPVALKWEEKVDVGRIKQMEIQCEDYGEPIQVTRVYIKWKPYYGEDTCTKPDDEQTTTLQLHCNSRPSCTHPVYYRDDIGCTDRGKTYVIVKYECQPSK